MYVLENRNANRIIFVTNSSMEKENSLEQVLSNT